MTTPETPPFQFGQEVWIASASAYGQKKVPCPVCFGKRSVVLILGNGEHAPIECDYCGKGQYATGTVTVRAPESSVVPARVTGLVFERGKWEVKCDRYHSSDDGIFSTQEEAEARRVVLFAEAEAHARESFESQFEHGKKGHGWKRGYHQREIKNLRRTLEWHEARLRERKAEGPR